MANAARHRSHTPRRNHYVPGATLRLRLTDAHDRHVDARYRLLERLPGGFAADVWRALALDTRRVVAIKLFTARGGSLTNHLKKRLRDLTHLAWFQSPYPYRHCEDAARSMLLTRHLLHRLSALDDDAPSVVEAVGYFWDRGARSFGLVLEWLEGRGPIYEEPDRLLIRRWRDPTIPTVHETPAWLKALRERMAWAEVWGFHEHLAQVYAGRRWGGAWLSLTNVKLAQTPGAPAPAARRLWWVDVEPAFPHVLWCFWFHVRLSVAAWRRGTFPSFDRVEMVRLRRRLDQYLRNGHCFQRDADAISALADRLVAARRGYDRSRVDLFGHRQRLLTDPTLRTAIRNGWIRHWHRCGDLSRRGRATLRRHPAAYWSSYGLEWLPGLGRTIRSLVWNERFRRHCWRLAGDNAYLRRMTQRWAVTRLAVWRMERRLMAFDRHAPIVTWLTHAPRAATLPVKWHRFTDDRHYRALVLDSVRRFLIDLRYRRLVYQRAFLRTLEQEHRAGKLPARRLAEFRTVVQRTSLLCYLEGQYLHLMPKIILYPMAIACVAAGVALQSPALLIATLFLGGVYREIVILLLGARYPTVPLGTALAIAWMPKIGNLACVLQMSRSLTPSERGLTYIFIRKAIARLTRLVPFLGGEDTLLEYYALQLFVNFPCSVWDALRRGR